MIWLGLGNLNCRRRGKRSRCAGNLNCRRWGKLIVADHPSSVYRVLKAAGKLARRWGESLPRRGRASSSRCGLNSLSIFPHLRRDLSPMARQFTNIEGSDEDPRAAKKVLQNVHLSFYPDAKIGVLGVNGSGKSTLAAHHGGHRCGIRRRRLPSPMARRVGYLPQEPHLDPDLGGARQCDARGGRPSRRSSTATTNSR